MDWKTIPGYENYEASVDGRIRRKVIKAKELKKIVRKNNGYEVVSIFDKNGNQKQESVHTLVLRTFVRPKRNKEVSRHMDGNKLNNNLGNLCWSTRRKRDGKFACQKS